MAASVRVRNVSRETDLASCASMADSFWRRLRGLLGRDGLEPGEGLVIEPCDSIHMIGMKFPLDVIHLDRTGKVLKVLTNIKPYHLGPYVWRSRMVVELPVGTVAAT